MAVAGGGLVGSVVVDHNKQINNHRVKPSARATTNTYRHDGRVGERTWGTVVRRDHRDKAAATPRRAIGGTAAEAARAAVT